MEISSKTERVVGSITLFLASCLIVLADSGPTLVAPTPIPLLAIAFLPMVLFPFLTPIIYLLCFKFVYCRSNAHKLVLLAVSAVSLLSIWYFLTSWGYGVSYQGLAYTRAIAFINFIVLTGLLIASFIAFRKNSKSLAKAVNFGLLLAVSWCVFPFLGELP